MDKKNGHLTTFELTIPTTVLNSLDFMVKEFDKDQDGSINRNGFVAHLISQYFVDNGYYDKFHDLKEMELFTNGLDSDCCPRCGSKNVHLVSDQEEYQELHCDDCLFDFDNE